MHIAYIGRMVSIAGIYDSIWSMRKVTSKQLRLDFGCSFDFVVFQTQSSHSVIFLSIIIILIILQLVSWFRLYINECVSVILYDNTKSNGNVRWWILDVEWVCQIRLCYLLFIHMFNNSKSHNFRRSLKWVMFVCIFKTESFIIICDSVLSVIMDLVQWITF